MVSVLVDEDRGVGACHCMMPPRAALTGATTQDGTDIIPLMKDELARATWSFKGRGALSDVDTKQNNSRLNGTRRPLSSRSALVWFILFRRAIVMISTTQTANGRPPRGLAGAERRIVEDHLNDQRALWRWQGAPAGPRPGPRRAWSILGGGQRSESCAPARCC